MCEYCEDGKYFYECEKDIVIPSIINMPSFLYDDAPSLSITDGMLTIINKDGLYGKEIDYCPMCGDSLREKVDDTSENDVQGYCPLCGGEYATRCSECGYCESEVENG